MREHEIINGLRDADFIYIAGNGGSASTANHFANDLVKMAHRKAISLCANEAVVMAYGNDDGYENIFTRQLEVFFDPKKDVLITISGSGTSPNIVNAQNYTEMQEGKFYAFPTMSELGCDMQQAEDYHLALSHKIASSLMK